MKLNKMHRRLDRSWGNAVATLHHKRSDQHTFLPLSGCKTAPFSFCVCVCVVCFSIHVQPVVVSSANSENCEEVVKKGGSV